MKIYEESIQFFWMLFFCYKNSFHTEKNGTGGYHGKKKIIVDGQYIQVCKKWSELERQQKEWILTKVRNQYTRIADTEHRPITNIEKKEILHSVYGQIHAKGIWIPFGEVGRVLSAKIAKWNGNRQQQYSQFKITHTQ